MSQATGATEATQPRSWWRVKIGCGALLIAVLVDHYLFGILPRVTHVPALPGQVLVIAGGLLTLYHHHLLARARGATDTPSALISAGGLYPILRHPMYAGDCLLYLGLFTMAPKLLGLVALMLGWLALTLQAKAEDRYLAERFGEAHSEWQRRSGLLLPGIRRQS